MSLMPTLATVGRKVVEVGWGEVRAREASTVGNEGEWSYLMSIVGPGDRVVNNTGLVSTLSLQLKII